MPTERTVGGKSTKDRRNAVHAAANATLPSSRQPSDPSLQRQMRGKASSPHKAVSASPSKPGRAVASTVPSRQSQPAQAVPGGTDTAVQSPATPPRATGDAGGKSAAAAAAPAQGVYGRFVFVCVCVRVRA